MIRRALAWLGITWPMQTADYAVTPATRDGHTIWDWRCNRCLSATGQAGDYDRATHDARVHLAAAHSTLEAGT